MNERFEELRRRASAEADISHIDFDNMSHTEMQMLGDIAVEKKLAELIVSECIEVCRAQATYDPIVLPYKPSEQFMTAIKKHFGVEE